MGRSLGGRRNRQRGSPVWWWTVTRLVMGITHMVHRYQIFMLYTRNLHNEKKKAFKDNFAITFYPPQLFEYLSYPNESWKSWDRKMRLEKTRLLSLSPLSRRPRLLNGQYCCLEVPLHWDFRYCSVEWYHDRRTWFKVSQTTQDKNLTWERRNTDPWDHKSLCCQLPRDQPWALTLLLSFHLFSSFSCQL